LVCSTPGIDPAPPIPILKIDFITPFLENSEGLKSSWKRLPASWLALSDLVKRSPIL